jgi:iron complex outermembrane recepter protein
MSFRVFRICGTAVTALSFSVTSVPVHAQQSAPPLQTELPDVEVVQQPDAPKPSVKLKKTTTPAAKPKPQPQPTAQAAKPESAPMPPPPAQAVKAAPPAQAQSVAEISGDPYAVVPAGQRSGSLAVPTTAEARAEIQRTAGGVDIVPSEEFAKQTPAATIKDALDFVPGVFVQPKFGEDSRLSIRGSGLSRNFHGRGVFLLMDGVIPFTLADGGSDFQEIDPTAFRYVEVFKGANALQYGANSLGGAINFVSPTGYDSDLFGLRVDAGSFGFVKTTLSSGAVSGNTDYFITGTWQQQDGFRDHSDGESFRGSANLGFRLSEDAETRFYLNANHIRQDIPGAVTRAEALSNPEGAFVRPGEPATFTSIGNDNVDRDYERNIDSLRVANRTAVRVQDGTVVEFGGFYMDRHLDHPIFAVVDNDTQNYGAFAKIVDDNRYGGYRNRFVGGLLVHNGETRARLFRNELGSRGALFSDADQLAENTTLYGENAFFVMPSLAIIGGLQFNHAERELNDRFLSNGDESRSADFSFWSPKVGLLYEATPEWQLFANVSRSGEAPTFTEITLTGLTTTALDVQRATTYEIGTRGQMPGLRWDVAVYRSNLDNEFQCRVNTGPGGVIIADGTCNQINLDKSIHQGVEAGASAQLLSGLFETGARADEIWLNAAYTFSDFRFDNDPVFGDNELPGAPRHYLRAELLYKHPTGVYFGPNIEWVPQDFFVDSANTTTVPSYALLGLRGGFDNGGPWSAYVDVRNVTDETYIASASVATRASETSALFEPGFGRAVYGGIQYRW